MKLSLKRYELIFVLALGAVLRVLHLFAWRQTPFFTNPTLDEFYHYLWAKKIATGGFETISAPFFRAPFYPYFLGFLMWLFKEEFFFPRLVQLVIGLFSVYIIWLLAIKITRKRAVGFFAALVAAIYPIFIYFESRFLLDFLLVFFSGLIFLLLIVSSEKNRFGLLFVTGIVVGLAGITRPNILFVAPVYYFWWILSLDRHKRKWLKAAITFFIGVLIPIAPVTIHNYTKSGEFVLISTQGGINFYIGNNPSSDGASSFVPGLGYNWQYTDCKVLAESESGKKLRPSELERFFYKKGVNFIISSPKSALKLYLKKLYLLLNKAEISDNQNINFHKRYSFVLRIPLGYWFIAPLGFSALLFARERKRLLLSFFVIMYSLTLLPFFITARLRLPIILPLIILATEFLFDTLKKASQDTLGFLKRYIVLLFFGTICLSSWYKIRVSDFSYSYYTLGNIYLREGRLDDALDAYAKALNINPMMKEAHLNMGAVYLKMRELKKAEEKFNNLLTIDSKSAEGYGNLAVTYMVKGEKEKAIELAGKSIEINPYYHDGYYILAQNLSNAENLDSALSVLKKGLELFDESRRLWFLYGVVCEKKGLLDDAEMAYKRAIELKEDRFIPYYDISEIYREELGFAVQYDKWLGIIEYNLGSLLAKKGRKNEGIRYLENAKLHYPELPDIYLQLGTAYYMVGRFDKALESYKKALSLGKDSAALRYNIAIVYIKLSKFDQAKQELNIALQLEPNFKLAKDALEKIR